MNIEEKAVLALKNKGLILTCAESCTGGMIASSIVNVSGASQIFHQGYVTYCDEAKVQMLNVKQETLDKYKAVSSNTACEMADGALKAAGADIAVSVTGVAGPSMEDNKPVGLVYIGIAFKQGLHLKANITEKANLTESENVCAYEYKFDGDRMNIRKQACENALKLVYEYAETLDF